MSLNNVNVYVYKSDGSYNEVTDLISTMKYSCGLDKVSQQLDITMSYGVYSVSLPSIYFDTGQKIEVYEYGTLYYRGKIETSIMSVDKEQITITCFDYMRNLTKSKVVYNFSAISAFDAVSQVFKDLEIPYSEEGIFGGKNNEESKIEINHLIKNKSAYDACMMIATEVHRNKGYYYYMFMDVAGNVNLMKCDYYWAKQTIQATSSSGIGAPDGDLISMTYKKDASDITTKVAVYDSKGEPVDIEAGVPSDSDDSDNEDSNSNSSNSSSSSNSTYIGYSNGSDTVYAGNNVEDYLNLANLTVKNDSGEIEKAETVNNSITASKSIIDTYGIRQQIVTQSTKKDPKVTALRELNDNCIPKEEITVEVIGDINYKVGYGVHVILPFLQKYDDCFMYIKEVSNEWKNNGIFISSLTLTPSRVMDEQEWTDLEDDDSSSSGGGSATAKKIIALMTQQIGKPYEWSKAGTDSFDCSGLTYYCFNQFSDELIDGKPIGRTTYEQVKNGKEVSTDSSKWEVGDLLFWKGDGSYAPPAHVSTYIGDNKMIEAPHTGANVRNVTISRTDIYAVRRVIPEDITSDSNTSDVDLSNASEMTMNLSFYTGAADEGGSKSASGKDLTYGMCASNVYPFGTKFYIKGINGLSDGIFTVEDTGGSDFDSSSRLDIYVGNGSSEKTKAENLGRQTCKAYKLK